MKRYFAVFLALVFIFNFTFISFSYADTITDLQGVEIGSSPSFETSTGEEEGKISVIKNIREGIDSVLTGIFATIVGVPLKILETITIPLQALVYAFPTIDGCIFNTQNYFRLSFFEANPKGIAGSMTSAVSAIYNAFRYLVTAIYIVVLVYLAVRMMFSSIGRQKAHYKDLFKHWIVGLLLLFSFHWVMAFIIWLSNTLVDIFAKMAMEILSGTSTDLLDVIFNLFGSSTQELYPITNFVMSRIVGGGAIGAADNWFATLLGAFIVIIWPVLLCFLLGSSFGVMMTYLKRIFTVAVLILIFPIVALSYVFDKIGDRKAQTLERWIKEFTVNVMIQPIHAIILVFIAILFSTGNGTEQGLLFGPTLVGAVMSIMALRLIPLGENLLKTFFQINSSMGPGQGGIAGQMAKNTMALRGAKSWLDSTAKRAGNLATLGKMGYVAYKANRDKGNSKGHSFRNALSPSEDILNQPKYKALSDKLKKDTGSDTLGGAIVKTYTQNAGAALGFGMAITGADKDFLSAATTMSAIGAELGTGVGGLKDGINRFKKDLKDAKDYEERANQIAKTDMSTLNEAEQIKIALDIGGKKEEIIPRNQKEIAQAYRDMAILKRAGLDNSELSKHTTFAKRHENAAKGLLFDGKTPMSMENATDIVATHDKIYGMIDGKWEILSNKGISSIPPGQSKQYADKAAFQAIMSEIDPLEAAADNKRIELKNAETNERKKMYARDTAQRKAMQSQQQLDEYQYNYDLLPEESKTRFTAKLNAETEVTTATARRDAAIIARDKALAKFNNDPSTENDIAYNRAEQEVIDAEANLTIKTQAKYDATTQYDNYISHLDDSEATRQQNIHTQYEALSTQATHDAQVARVAETEYKEAHEAREKADSAKRQADKKLNDKREEIDTYLKIDQAVVDGGGTPRFTETVAKAVTSGNMVGTLQRDNTHIYWETPSGNYTVAHINDSSITTPVSLGVEEAWAIQNIAYNGVYNTLMPDNSMTYGEAVQQAQANVAQARENYRSNQSDATYLALQNALAGLSDIESQVEIAAGDVLSGLTASDVESSGASQEVVNAFNLNAANKAATGKNIVSSIKASAQQSFHYGVCEELRTLLTSYGNPINSMSLTYYEDPDNEVRQVSYAVYGANSNHPTEQGTIDVDEHFISEAFTTRNNVITLQYLNKDWFIAN